MIDRKYIAEPYEEIKQKILAGQRLGCPEQLSYLTAGETLYSEVMLPCWASQPTARPSFTNIMASLETMLGEEGLAQYEEMFSDYMRRLPLIHREGEDAPQPLPSLSHSQNQSGYIRINSVDCGGGAGAYIKMETAERNPADEGYSRHTTTGGGYIALRDINK